MFVVTDVHVDKDANAEWLAQLPARDDYSNDVLILCGDVADNMDALTAALKVS